MLINCKECGKEISDTVVACPNCGYKLNNKKKKKPNIIVIIVIIIMFIIGSIIAAVIYNNIIQKQEREKYESLPIKVDISMTSYYGSIEYILYELGLDFDLVTMGANCFTGVQKNEFQTEKYGLLHTEFRYCKSNKTTIFRVYNDEKDQPLREPKEGELSTFNQYGNKITSKNDQL